MPLSAIMKTAQLVVPLVLCLCYVKASAVEEKVVIQDPFTCTQLFYREFDVVDEV